MKSETVCCGCGRAIESDFIYCPWCGHSRVADNDRESSAAVFARIERRRSDMRMQHIKAISRQLDDLEKELNILVLSSEMHK